MTVTSRIITFPQTLIVRDEHVISKNIGETRYVPCYAWIRIFIWEKMEPYFYMGKNNVSDVARTS